MLSVVSLHEHLINTPFVVDLDAMTTMWIHSNVLSRCHRSNRISVNWSIPYHTKFPNGTNRVHHLWDAYLIRHMVYKSLCYTKTVLPRRGQARNDHSDVIFCQQDELLWQPPTVKIICTVFNQNMYVSLFIYWEMKLLLLHWKHSGTKCWANKD